MDALALFLQTAIQMGTPMLLATVGGILCEKSGHLNLGIEGMMLIGAVMGFKIGQVSGNPILAISAAAISGGLAALIYAIITVTLRGNHIVTGLTLTIFGTGVANYIGKSIVVPALPESVKAPFRSINIPLLTKIPILGKSIFNQSIYVHIAIIIAILAYIYLNRTRLGLNLRSVGENPAAADASGINVDLYKYVHIIIGGALCGVGGSYLSIVEIGWRDNLTAGIGWIAVVLIIFSTWDPLKAMFGAYFFGALRALGFQLQSIKLPFSGETISVPIQLLDMIPYIATIIVLVLITIRKKEENQAPASLGSPYFREDR
ncbi:MAG: ABC transporter permease [Clostridiales bacterium]|nr:ABC transporter permease [Clostridiales bacterium]